jgi:ribosomal protein S18 acetylase RimI-like enzyme
VTVEVRAATEDDLVAIQAIGHATWPETYGFAGDDFVAHGLATWWSEDAVRRSLTTTSTLVAVSDGAIVGVGNLDLHRDPPTIWKVYVLPSAQGLGAGSALLGELVRLAEGRTVTLEYVDGNDRAAAFYERQGFVEVRRQAAESAGLPETVWMEHPAAEV